MARLLPHCQLILCHGLGVILFNLFHGHLVAMVVVLRRLIHQCLHLLLLQIWSIVAERVLLISYHGEVDVGHMALRLIASLNRMDVVHGNRLDVCQQHLHV